MSEGNAAGHSLWLVPPEPEREQLSVLIRELSTSFGTPVFEPHLTLLGGLEDSLDDLWSRAEQLALTLAPFQVHVEGVETGEDYFQSLFVRVKITSELRQAELRARQKFGSKRTAPFVPHVSLLYGTIAADAKARVRSEFASRLPKRFSLDRLCLVSTEGPPEAWAQVGETRIVAPNPSLE